MLCDDLEGWNGWGGRRGSRGSYMYMYTHIHKYVCILIADSHCYRADMNTTL